MTTPAPFHVARSAWRAPLRRAAVRAPAAVLAGPSRRLRLPETSTEVGHASQRRGYASGSGKSNRVGKERYNFNTSLDFSAEPDPDHVNYRRVTASELSSRTTPPTRVKMLVRDFIDDSLYNPSYGYFSRNATIFTPPDEGYEFGGFRDAAAFQEAVAGRYEEFEAREVALEEAEAGAGAGTGEELATKGKVKGKGKEIPGRSTGGLGRQVWHTPTELFKPHYARALTQAILTPYKLNHFPYQDLLIYEVGAGNGSFMLDSLRFLRDRHPEVFARTKYRIVEISAALAEIQRKRAEEAGFGDVVEVINEDVFRWEGGGVEPCFVVALEVFDNFAHDMIRYDLRTLEPLQAVVSIDSTGDFSLLYEPLSDPLLRRVLAYRRLLPPTPSTLPPLSPPLLVSPFLRKLYGNLPFAPNLSPPDFIPTKAVLFLERLRDRLPAHRLLVADFDELPDAVEGRNGPVVQTRYGGSMVPCETFLVKQGYFDIFFPTDFELLRDTYSLIMNSPSPSRQAVSSSRGSSGAGFPSTSLPKSVSVSATATVPNPSSSLAGDFFFSTGVRGFRRRQVGIHPQAEFLELYGGEECVGPTRVRDGGSVMLGMYGNAKVMF